MALVLKTSGRNPLQVRILYPPQIGKRQRCARRGGGRGERIEASQRDKFETATERKKVKEKCKNLGFLERKVSC